MKQIFLVSEEKKVVFAFSFFKTHSPVLDGLMQR